VIEFPEFISEVERTLGRRIVPTETGNAGQYEAIESGLGQSLYIVAGPGSGKTTVMVLRILKLIYVDGVDPSTIFATTFTKKAAAELRSRVLGWGDQLRKSFLENPSYATQRDSFRAIDFNQIVIGTLDSISEELLREYREPGSPPPVVIEEFIANALMVREGLLQGGRYRNDDLKDYISSLRGGRMRLNTGIIGGFLLEIKDRIYHDRVDFDRYCNEETHPGVSVACEAIQAYRMALDERLLYDYAKLEREFCKKLADNYLSEFTANIRFVLVDEYQDTNLLQEQIYFELSRKALENGGGIAVVGDDDQSIYRFRGATVDLFTNFPARIWENLGIHPRLIMLSENYRSTENIVRLISNFISLDRSFQNVRVSKKPSLRHARTGDSENYPILGMFRDDIETLAKDLSKFIYKVVNGGYPIDYNGRRCMIAIDRSKGGSPADLCVLCSSPQETRGNNNMRLPGLLRIYLQECENPIKVFNPRGQTIRDVQAIQILCGLLLECIDPGGRVQNSIQTLPHEAREAFEAWRWVAKDYIGHHLEEKGGITLEQFVSAWQNRRPLNTLQWKREIPLLDLVYHLVTWIPELQHDVEGLVYLEVVTRTITQSAVFNSFESKLVFDEKEPTLLEKSIIDAMRGIFIPLATGAIEINEDLLETVPRDRVPIMSIHQAKGLEYPVVIVDVGSDFKIDHHTQRFKRYPTDGGVTCKLEDEMRKYSPLQQPERTGGDRAFDDLIRLYFVAFSRAQDVLMLVGLNSVKDGYFTRGKHQQRKFIPNVATGWDRDGNWHWGEGLPNIIHI